MSPLDAALTSALTEFSVACQERDEQRTETTWPSHHDIYARTVSTVKALVSGELDPTAYLRTLE